MKTEIRKKGIANLNPLCTLMYYATHPNLYNLVYSLNPVTAKIYENYFPLDSTVESRFARDCETSEQIEFYFKLPFWFKIPTPVGSYNPDWALVLKDKKKIYFVAETKSTLDVNKRRKEENQKINCGERYFYSIDEVKFKEVTKLGELINFLLNP